MRIAVLALSLLAFAAPAAAQDDLETQAKEIETKIMAPCCGGSPVATHYSAPAIEVKREVREMLAAGWTERAILDHYVEEFGEVILSSPRAEGFGLVAWLGPFVLMLVAGGGLALALRGWNRRHTAEPAPALPEIAPEDRARIEAEVAEES